MRLIVARCEVTYTGRLNAHLPESTRLLMLKEDFVAASANIENLDPGAGDYPIARQRIDNAGLETVMSNSFGFGGTNACLVFSRYNH